MLHPSTLKRGLPDGVPLLLLPLRLRLGLDLGHWVLDMRYAIVSDVHGRREQLATVLHDTQARGAEQILCLGDVGGSDCLELLRRVNAQAVFGNYEVSGWRRLTPEHQSWVQSWRPLLVADDFLAVHAAPWGPEGLQTVEEFGVWLRRTGRPWRALFPYLSEDDDSLWRALTVLERMDKAVLFHGHTHQQDAWCWDPADCLRPMHSITFTIHPGHRYVVGVGSAGMPEDGSWAAYTLYDLRARQIERVRLNARGEPWTLP